LPANGVRLVGDLSSIQSAAIPPTPTWTGRSPFLEPRIGDIHCWFGPAETWGIAGTVKAGVRIEITSLLEGGEWFQIGNPDRPGTHCWARWLDVLVYNDLSQLPVMAVDDFPSIMAIDAGVNCRTNPSRDADIVGALIPETAVPIVAVLGDSSWWLIENPDNPGTVCWVSGTVTKVSGDVSKIPVIPITP
jgi:hypothetical protein